MSKAAFVDHIRNHIASLPASSFSLDGVHAMEGTPLVSLPMGDRQSLLS
jgi:hypothetical protein